MSSNLIGISNFTIEQFRAVRQFGDYDACQPPYSLLAHGIEDDLLPYCEAENVGVMVFSPLHKGLLTGKYTGSETFEDFRKSHADFQGDRFRTVAGLATLAEKYGMTIPQLILTATLMHPGIQVAVVGIKSQQHIRDAAGAMGATLGREDYFAVQPRPESRPISASGTLAAKSSDWERRDRRERRTAWRPSGKPGPRVGWRTEGGGAQPSSGRAKWGGYARVCKTPRYRP